jgi:hypothetical protein
VVVFGSRREFRRHAPCAIRNIGRRKTNRLTKVRATLSRREFLVIPRHRRFPKPKITFSTMKGCSILVRTRDLCRLFAPFDRVQPPTAKVAPVGHVALAVAAVARFFVR